MRPHPEASAFLAVSCGTIYKLINSGELPYVMVNSEKRIPRAALVAYVERRTQRAGVDAQAIAS
jgi:excisionase family DNA binding protein